VAAGLGDAHPAAGAAAAEAPGRLDRRRGGRAAGARPGRRRPGSAVGRPGRAGAGGGRAAGGDAGPGQPGRRPAQAAGQAGQGRDRRRPGGLPGHRGQAPEGLLQGAGDPVRPHADGAVLGLRLPPRPQGAALGSQAEAALPRRPGTAGPGRGQVQVRAPGRQPGAGPRVLHLRPDRLGLAHRRPRRQPDAPPRRRRDLGQRPGEDRPQPPHPDRPPSRRGGPGPAAAAGRRPRLRPDRRRLDRPLGAQGGDPRPQRPGRGRAAGRRPQPVAGGRRRLLVGRVGSGRFGPWQPDRGQHRQRGRLQRPQPPDPRHPRDDPRRHPYPRSRGAAAAGRGVRRLGRPQAGRLHGRGDPPGPGPAGRQRPLRRPPARRLRVPGP
jgi:hypothetical protein